MTAAIQAAGSAPITPASSGCACSSESATPEPAVAGGGDVAAANATDAGLGAASLGATNDIASILAQLVQTIEALIAALQGTSGGGAPGQLPPATPSQVPGQTPADDATQTTPPAAPTTPASTTPAPPLPAPAETPPAAMPPPAPSAPVSNAREGVLLIGDSLTVGVRPHFTEGLVTKPVEVNATGGISLQEGMRRYRATADKPRVVEMALFTNNGPGDITKLRDAITETINDARERGGKVVWATIVRPPVGGKSYDDVNAMIRQMAADNADVMGMVDWAQMVKDTPSLVGRDGIHSGTAGYKARAAAFAEAARR